MSVDGRRIVYAGRNPKCIAVDDSRHLAYVSNQSGNAVSVIKYPTTTVPPVIQDRNFRWPQAVVFNPSNNLIYVTNYGFWGPEGHGSTWGNTVSIISGEDVINTITVGFGPSAIAYNPSNKLVYVANEYSGTVSAIDSNTHSVRFEVRVSDVDYGPWGITYNPLDNNMYVTNYGDFNFRTPTVAVIRNDMHIHDIYVNSVPCAIAFSPQYKKIYVTINEPPWNKPTSQSIVVIDADPTNGDTYQHVIDTLTFDGLNRPFGIAYNPQDKNMYVTNSGGNTVSVLSDTTLVDTINVGEWPLGIAYHPTEQKMIVANQRSNDVYMIP